VLNTGDIATEAGLMAESYEDMFLRVEDVVVTTLFPDSDNYGEFAVDDGTGEVRVDDFSYSFDGNLDSTFTEGLEIEFLQGFLWFSFDNFKLQPQDYDDLLGSHDGPGMPITFALLPARPNPGAHRFLVSYILPKEAAINLSVYDVAGRRVSTLFDGLQAAGRHELSWNSDDAQGRSVPSGTYIVRLEANDRSKNERVIVLR
jgi:hypothetical protein